MSGLIVIITIGFFIAAQRLVYKYYWLKGLGMNIGFSASRATEGEYIIVSEVLENAKLLPLPWVDVKFQVSGNLVFDGSHADTGTDSVRSELFSIGAYKRLTRSYKVLCSRRGHYIIKSMSVTSQDLLMSCKRVTQFTCGESLTVYPSTLPYDTLSPVYRRVMGSVRVRRFINQDPFEFRGIREYESGDPLRCINHRATAKTGELMVNVFEPTASRNVTLWLGTDAYSAYDLPHVYEMSIRLAATLAEQLIADGLSVGLKTGAMNALAKGERINVQGGAGAGHLLMILEALALTDLTQPPEPMAELLAPAGAGGDSVHVLISSYDGEDLERAVEMLRNTGQDIVWILPRRKDTRLRVRETESVLCWEVV